MNIWYVFFFRNPNDGPSETDVLWPEFDDSAMIRFRAEPSVEKEDSDLKEDYDFWNDEFPNIARPSGELPVSILTEEGKVMFEMLP